MKALNLNDSYKHHIGVAVIMGVWLALFLVLIAPFDASNLPFLVRIKILPFYGVIALASYLILIPIQNFIFTTIKTWNLALEIAFVFTFNLIALIGCYLYYQSDIINGTYQLARFTWEIYYPIFFFLFLILILSRWHLNKKTTNQEKQKITLKGESKLDILRIELSDLVSISSANNYVEVNYLKNGVLSNKLLRTTLKNIHSDIPSLLKVHRSYLINPSHFKDWKDSNKLHLTQMEVPVSKNYKKVVLAVIHSSQKANASPQTQ